jgi:hypothetical protein
VAKPSEGYGDKKRYIEKKMWENAGGPIKRGEPGFAKAAKPAKLRARTKLKKRGLK